MNVASKKDGVTSSCHLSFTVPCDCYNVQTSVFAALLRCVRNLHVTRRLKRNVLPLGPFEPENNAPQKRMQPIFRKDDKFLCGEISVVSRTISKISFTKLANHLCWSVKR